MSLNGDRIDISISSPLGTRFSNNRLVRDPGAEAIVPLFLFGPSVIVDVADDSFNLRYSRPIQFSGPTTVTLSDLDWVDDPSGFITGVTSTGQPGATASFTDDSITVVFPGNTLLSPATPFSFDITTECFLPGTRILTDRGNVPVETLAIGDRVKVADGSLHTIKWVGKQTVDPNRVKNSLRSYPVRVRAGALGNDLPHNDLYISPDHALLVDGLLINTGALVNGASIVQTEPTEIFTYYHVELDTHELLVVEGTCAESYLPQSEDRQCYDNSDEFDRLYPDQNRMLLWPLEYPRVSSMTTVPRFVRKRLATVATQLGYETASEQDPVLN